MAVTGIGESQLKVSLSLQRNKGWANLSEVSSIVHLKEVRAFANIPSENNTTNAGRMEIDRSPTKRILLIIAT
ncbi:hypothetical protein ACTXT7_006189 [Hymenolepis weldensis]